MRKLIDRQWFALVDLFLVLICGAVWMVKPEWGIWSFLAAVVPMVLRVFSGRFRYNSVDLLVLVFAATAWTGYWAAYDQTTACRKVWLIMTAVLLYFSLKAQPKDNLVWVSLFSFCVGIGVSMYYFLTQDFIAAPRKLEFVNQLGRMIMDFRPQTGWASIHPNYVAGIVAVTIPFVFYPALKFKNSNNPLLPLFYAFVLIGLGLAGFTLVMATSRGVLLAIVSGVGAWILWRLINLKGIKRNFTGRPFFTIFLFLYLCVMVAFLFLGPTQVGIVSSGTYYYGNGSRGELFARSIYLLLDYSITGGGLGSFPGLYSQYLLNIPYFNVPNSHNLFLDVAIEQGLLGGLSFLLMYLASIWLVSRSLTQEKTMESQALHWILLFSLIVAVVHGMVDDYLYNSNGTILSLFLVAISVMGTQANDLSNFVKFQLDRRIVGIWLLVIAVMSVICYKDILSAWYANLGSVRMSQVELDGFPNNGWAGSAIVSRLDDAEIALRSSLQYDPNNRTANQRLGMISMLGRNFESASDYLETAYRVAPGHRGIIKSLGYCYVWLGDLEKAQVLLAQIPEAVEELDVYIWWWEAQGRSDLAAKANSALDMLSASKPQP